MKLVDLSKFMHKGSIIYNALLWEESDTIQKHIEYVGSYFTLTYLSKKLCEKFPNDFPSERQIYQELETIDKLNTKNNKNSQNT